MATASAKAIFKPEMRFLSLLLLGFVIGGSGPVAARAEAQDPFQSAPIATPAPKPAPRPRPAPEPEPAVVLPPARPPAPVAPFDGIWVGTYSCEATRAKPSASFVIVLEIKNGNWSRLNTRNITPGQPGYDHYEGTIGSDGRVMLMRTGVGAGTMVGGAGMGEPISVRFAGAFQGDRFSATALDTQRDCRIELTRHR
jgi:hypothetical protein